MTAVGKRTRLLVADDHPLYHEGVARAVSTAPWLELVARVELARDALDEIRRLKPDVALVDLGLPDLDGIAVLELLKPDALDTRVVIVSASEDRAMVYRAIAAGARAYLSKVSSASTLLSTIEAVARGETVIPPSMQAGLAEEIRARQARATSPCSPRASWRSCARRRGQVRAGDRQGARPRRDDGQDAPPQHLREARRSPTARPRSPRDPPRAARLGAHDGADRDEHDGGPDDPRERPLRLAVEHAAARPRARPRRAR